MSSKTATSLICMPLLAATLPMKTLYVVIGIEPFG